jgi:membrane protein
VNAALTPEANDGSDPDGPLPERPVPGVDAILDRMPDRVAVFARRMLDRWPGRVVMRTTSSSMRIELFDRSMTIAAQLFTSVFPILIALSTLGGPNPGFIAKETKLPDETYDVLTEAFGAPASATFGIVGALIVLVSATSLSRALTRAFAAIWQLPRPKTRLNAAWRWVAVVMGLAVSLVIVNRLTQFAGEIPPPRFWEITVALTCDVLVAVYIPWLLLAGALSRRWLIPGALIYAAAMAPIRQASRVLLPQALEASAGRYGSIGVAFTYLAWLYAIAFCLLLASVLGYVITTDDGRFGRWIRGHKPDASPQQSKAEPVA